jgi:hypothetical protein
MDLRQIITDNSLKDIQTEEDGKFIALIDEIVGTDVSVGASGYQQNFTINSDMDRDSYVSVLSKLEDFYLNNGVFLMNRRTAKRFLTWDRSEIGGDLAQSLLTEGLSALTEAKVMGANRRSRVCSIWSAGATHRLCQGLRTQGKFINAAFPRPGLAP